MHPSNCDHKDMQKRGVPNISSKGSEGVWEGRHGWAEMEGAGWGAHKIKEKRRRGIPGTVPLHLNCLVCICGCTKSNPQVRDLMKCNATQV